MSRLSRLFIRCALAVVGLHLSSAAHAQLGTGMSGQSTTRYVEGAEAWQALASFGLCYARKDRQAALEFVTTRPGSAQEAKVYKKLFASGSYCLTMVDEMDISYQLVRGVVAEGLFQAAAPLPPHLVIHDIPTAQTVRSFADAAVCYAKSNPEAVRMLLQTKLGSPTESAFAKSLMPQMKACFPPNATRALDMSYTLIRFRLAEALWRLGSTPTGGNAQ